MTKKHLFVGYGDIASRCAKSLIEGGDEIVGIARSHKAPMNGLELWRGDAKSGEIQAKIAAEYFESVCIILSPDAYSEDAYRACYFDVVQTLVDCWKQPGSVVPGRIIFVSSSSVYAQNHGDYVNEASSANPSSPTAKVLRESENLLLENFTQATVVRFSGIYGPGREFLLRQVLAGKGGNAQHTNRIHIDDCCGVLLHILAMDQKLLQPIYLASDNLPVRSDEIRVWLAKQLNIATPLQNMPITSGRGGDKKCDNTLLIKSGSRFRYGSYIEGYAPMVEHYLATK